MKQRRRIYYSAAQRSEIWDRWQAGEQTSSQNVLQRSVEPAADIVEKVENRQAPKISQKSNVSDLSRSKALQDRYERRWSFLR